MEFEARVAEGVVQPQFVDWLAAALELAVSRVCWVQVCVFLEFLPVESEIACVQESTEIPFQEDNNSSETMISIKECHSGC